MAQSTAGDGSVQRVNLHKQVRLGGGGGLTRTPYMQFERERGDAGREYRQGEIRKRKSLWIGEGGREGLDIMRVPGYGQSTAGDGSVQRVHLQRRVSGQRFWSASQHMYLFVHIFIYIHLSICLHVYCLYIYSLSLYIYIYIYIIYIYIYLSL